jgi:hypothetical protein
MPATLRSLRNRLMAKLGITIFLSPDYIVISYTDIVSETAA